ncbi:oligoendopeptidase F [Oscillibacter valericigenes Sjm18-20]|nr:oligoendopeptidase F [Oscillibacter valericigenes Sjm18-20]
MELKSRNEIEEIYKWDLKPIFKSPEDWEKAYAEAKKTADEIGLVAGTLGQSAESMKAGLDQIFTALQKVELVYSYASLLKSGDNGDSKYQEMSARAMNLFVALDTSIAFVDPEILAVPEEKLKGFLTSDALKGYHHIIEDIDRSRAHTLDEKGEELMAKLGDVAQTPDNCFTMLESVDMQFPKIKDESGNEQQLTHGNFSVFRESASADVRRESFEKYFGEFKKYINTWAAMYAGSVKVDCYYADVRGFDNACERALFASNVPVSVYDSLVESIHGGLPTMERYLKLRKKLLGLDELNMYDLYCPIVNDVKWEMSLEESKELVKKATAPLGENYAKLLDRAFQERWMDIYENKGKTTGAFSSGVYGVHPYILLNFSNRLDDAFTMVHELGHAMHSFLSDANQDYANHDYRIMVAEVASTVNEVLLTKYLLQSEHGKKRRAYVLNHFLEGFRTTVFRQTLFAEFEREAHDMYQRGNALTAESLSQVYHRLNEKYYVGVKINDLQDYEWSRIPHFYNAFYVYQYATGFCSAVAIADNILKTGDASNYLKFLTTGGSMYPLDELKIAGIDLTRPDTVANALKIFEETLDEFEKLMCE